MKPRKASVVWHFLGVILFLFSIVCFHFSSKIEVLLMGMNGLTLIWLIALERDVYAKD